MARESYIYDKREGVQIMRILLVCVVSVLLFIFVIVGSPMYVNFYGSDASLAFLSMSRVITLIACFMPLFLLAQLIVSALCRLMSSAGSKGGKFLSLKRLINSGGACIYGLLIVYCAIWNMADFLIHGSAAYRNFPISLGVATYLGLALETARLLALAFRKPVVRDDFLLTNDLSFSTVEWKSLKVNHSARKFAGTENSRRPRKAL